MSFLPFGRPQPSSAEKIAAAETEMEMVSEMMIRYIQTELPQYEPNLTVLQFNPVLSQKMYSSRVPRRGSQQRRICLPGSMRFKILRCADEGQREDAGRCGVEAGTGGVVKGEERRTRSSGRGHRCRLQAVEDLFALHSG